MRRVRYRVAASLDGFIAGPRGEIDWILPDPTVDFAAIFAEFDTALLGRRTYELTLQPGAPPWPPGYQIYVFSKTLDPAAHPAVSMVAAGAASRVASLRARPGKDIWLFGGGALFGSLVAEGMVDQVEVAVMPVLLGAGAPLAVAAPRTRLTLSGSRTSPRGIVTLTYDIAKTAG